LASYYACTCLFRTFQLLVLDVLMKIVFNNSYYSKQQKKLVRNKFPITFHMYWLETGWWASLLHITSLTVVRFPWGDTTTCIEAWKCEDSNGIYTILPRIFQSHVEAQWNMRCDQQISGLNFFLLHLAII
jgi:hypothetical protein